MILSKTIFDLQIRSCMTFLGKKLCTNNSRIFITGSHKPKQIICKRFIAAINFSRSLQKSQFRLSSLFCTPAALFATLIMYPNHSLSAAINTNMTHMLKKDRRIRCFSYREMSEGASEDFKSKSDAEILCFPMTPSPFPDCLISVTSSVQPPQPTDTQKIWLDLPSNSSLLAPRRIFCNRSLNMDSINAVGFDMDYTLAQYKPETFETLTYQETVNKLIRNYGYPKLIRELVFDWRYMMRGLVIDKKRGNIIKVDRHKYVKLAYHGFKTLTREERQNTYSKSELRDSLDEPDYSLIYTLFSLSEAHLFMSLVQMKDLNINKESIFSNKTYMEMYQDIRNSVDMCHRDGTLKQQVANEPEKYIHADPSLIPLLKILRQSGKLTFIATNSLWDYTNVVMNYLIGGKKCNRKTTEWLDYFDIVITGCEKPKFFNCEKPLFIVDGQSGQISDMKEYESLTDNGISNGNKSPEEHIKMHKIYQGGTYMDLHKMLGISSGAEVLYVGDHIYGDILRSKKTIGWRTMLVVPELEKELEILKGCGNIQNSLRKLRLERDNLEECIQRLEWKIKFTETKSNIKEMLQILQELQNKKALLKIEHCLKLRQHHEQFHPVWGQLLKTGYQNSLLAYQIERYACLYTSHVSNLLFSSPHKRYRGRIDIMAHEEGIIPDSIKGNGYIKS